MFEFLNMFFSVKVVEEHNKIIVSHVPMESIGNDIQKVYKTTRVGKYLFNNISKTSFEIESFFALELYFILTNMLNARRLDTNVKVLKEIQVKLKENTWLKNIDTDFPDRLDFKQLEELSYPPLPFQFEFLKRYSKATQQYNLNGMLLAGSAGSGKTYSSLALAHCLHAERCIIVAPLPAVFRVWEDNIEKVFKRKQSYWISSLGKPYKGERFVIYHYEALPKAFELIKELKTSRTVVILDESHNLNEFKALRTQRFIELCATLETKDIVLASGTAVKALAVETIPLFKAIDPLFNDNVMERFKKIFQGEASVATNMLAERLDVVSFKVEKSELNLKEPIFKDIVVKIPNGDVYTLKSIGDDIATFAKERTAYYNERFAGDSEFFKSCLAIAKDTLLSSSLSKQKLIEATADFNEYNNKLQEVIYAYRNGQLRYCGKEMAFCSKYEKESISPTLPTKEMRDRFKDVKSVVKYVRLKIQGECLGRILGRKRIDVHLDMIPHIPFKDILNSTFKKTVVFTSYVEVVEKCIEHLTDKHLHPVAVYGKMNSQLNQILTKFETDEVINPLVATYASLSTAVPLIMADTMVMINAPFRNYVLEQTVSRIHRIGADTQTYVYSLILDTGDEVNISSRSVDILKWSQEQVEKILKMESPFKIGEGDVTEFNEALESMDGCIFDELCIRKTLEEVIAVESSQLTPTENILTKW